MFPDTTIASGAYVIVWADKDDEQEGLHASFKLWVLGELIILSDLNMNLIDEISYLEQKPDTTTGRYLNGTGEFIEMLPTFEAENIDLLSAISEQNMAYKPEFSLRQNRPNPFSSSTRIAFNIQKGDYSTLRIYNSHENLIRTFVSAYLPAGDYSYLWQADGLANGLYLYTITVGGKTESRKMIIQ